jgi:cysteine desulfurase
LIYLDNAASTKIHDDVLKEMLPYLKDQFGNPSSIHKYGRFAQKAIQKARKQVANLINADESEIFFTSGGTESNNTALYGIAKKYPGSRIITSLIEHDAILEPCKKLEEEGFDVIYLPVDAEGQIAPALLKDAINENTSLVSIMSGNNEVGTLEPIADFVNICHEQKIPFHTDAVQAIGKIPLNVKELGIDLISISSHKINGPKGVGALFVRKGLAIDPVILGGGQEHGLRSGTENVANIVGFGKACELAKNNFFENTEKMKSLQDYLSKKILQNISNVKLNGHPEKRLPNNVHLTFLGVNGEDLLIKLDENGIAASTGSACSVHIQKASHVLKAMGFSHEQITGSLRLTVGISNTFEEMDKTVEILKNVVEELRSVSPYKQKYSF